MSIFANLTVPAQVTSTIKSTVLPRRPPSACWLLIWAIIGPFNPCNVCLSAHCNPELQSGCLVSTACLELFARVQILPTLHPHPGYQFMYLQRRSGPLDQAAPYNLQWNGIPTTDCKHYTLWDCSVMPPNCSTLLKLPTVLLSFLSLISVGVAVQPNFIIPLPRRALQWNKKLFLVTGLCYK